MRRLLIPLLLLPVLVLANAEHGLEEYAAGYPVTVDGDHAIYRMALPDAVYATAVRRDLGDLRVFNANGETVSHTLRRPQRISSTKEARVSVPLFPVSPVVRDLRTSEVLDVVIREDGSIVRIVPREGGYETESARIDSYVIDLSGIDQPVDTLQLTLTGVAAPYIARLSLLASDDLDNWQPFVGETTVAELQYGGNALKKDVIELPRREVDYLRVDWRDGPAGLQIREAIAVLSQSSTQSGGERRWLELKGRGSEDEELAIEYGTEGVYPVDRVELVLNAENTVIDAVLYSRPSPKAAWVRRGEGLFYRLKFQGTELERDALSIAPTADRYWRLALKSSDGAGATPPALRIGWIPDDLYFLARGPGPFTVAFGSGRAGPPAKPIDALMQALGERQSGTLVGTAQPGEAVTLMGEAALAKELEIPWQRIVLWSILVSGVAVIALMALRLMRQVKA